MMDVTMDCDKCKEFQYRKGLDDFLRYMHEEHGIDLRNYVNEFIRRDENEN